MLLFLTMTALLPSIVKFKIRDAVYEVQTGGRNQSVVWFECSSRLFDIRKLIRMIHTHLENQLASARAEGRDGIPDGLIESEVIEILKNLHIFTPCSTIQLAASIQSLPEYIKGLKNEFKDIGFLVIEGMSEFYWSDRFTRDTTTTTTGSNKKNSNLIPSIKYLQSAIAHIRLQLAPIILISQPLLQSTPANHSQEGFPFFPSHFPPPWPSINSSIPQIDNSNPLTAPMLINSDLGTFYFKYSISIFPPKPLPNTATMREAMNREPQERRFTAVVRSAEIGEVGSFEFEFDENSFSA